MYLAQYFLIHYFDLNQYQFLSPFSCPLHRSVCHHERQSLAPSIWIRWKFGIGSYKQIFSKFRCYYYHIVRGNTFIHLSLDFDAVKCNSLFYFTIFRHDCLQNTQLIQHSYYILYFKLIILNLFIPKLSFILFLEDYLIHGYHWWNSNNRLESHLAQKQEHTCSQIFRLQLHPLLYFKVIFLSPFCKGLDNNFSS